MLLLKQLVALMMALLVANPACCCSLQTLLEGIPSEAGEGRSCGCCPVEMPLPDSGSEAPGAPHSGCNCAEQTSNLPDVTPFLFEADPSPAVTPEFREISALHARNFPRVVHTGYLEPPPPERFRARYCRFLL